MQARPVRGQSPERESYQHRPCKPARAGLCLISHLEALELARHHVRAIASAAEPPHQREYGKGRRTQHLRPDHSRHYVSRIHPASHLVRRGTEFGTHPGYADGYEEVDGEEGQDGVRPHPGLAREPAQERTGYHYARQSAAIAQRFIRIVCAARLPENSLPDA